MKKASANGVSVKKRAAKKKAAKRAESKAREPQIDAPYIDPDIVGLAVPIDQVHRDPANARKHSKKSIEAISGALTRFGQVRPILADRKGKIIAGNGTHEAAQALGWGYIAVVRSDKLSGSPVEAAAYGIADNRTAEVSSFDDEALSELLSSIADESSLDGLGWDDAAVKRILQSLEEEKSESGESKFEGDVNAALEKWKTEPGQIWAIGRHRLACGDSTDEKLVSALFGDARPLLMVTDPPYGVEYDPKWREGVDGKPRRSVGAVVNDDKFDWLDAWALFPGSVVYVWHAAWYAAELAVSLSNARMEIRNQIVWKKQSFSISRGHYHWGHEPCWYAVRKR